MLSFSFIQLVVLTNFRLSYSHDENNIVNFNDAEARISRIVELSSSSIEVHYGGNVTLVFNASRAVIFYYIHTIILEPYNGWILYYLSNEAKYYILTPSRNQTAGGNTRQRFFGPMSNQGFWLYRDQSDKQTRLTIHAIKAQVSSKFEWLDVYSAETFSPWNWKFVRMFRWNGDLFLGYTGEEASLIIRLKDLPDDIERKWEYISGFFIDRAKINQIYFSPSYPSPILYFNQIEVGPVGPLYSLKLEDAVKTSDEGIQQCGKQGRYPSDFYKLDPFINNLSRISWKEDDNCKTGISMFRFNNPISCLSYNSLGEKSVEIYTVGFDFNVRILSYIENDRDFRCNLSECGAKNITCKDEKAQLNPEEITSIFWNFENFTLIRWTEKGDMKQSRLLDCEYFTTCALCTLYGGFNCRWNSSSCVGKSSNDGKSKSDCYSNVTGTVAKDGSSSKKFQITIQLPHKLNEKAGEKASVILDGEEFLDVKYADNVYILGIDEADIKEASINIKRGAYNMITSFSIQKQEESYTLLILTYVLVAMAFILIAGTVVFATRKLKKNGDRDMTTKSSSKAAYSETKSTSTFSETRQTDQFSRLFGPSQSSSTT